MCFKSARTPGLLLWGSSRDPGSRFYPWQTGAITDIVRIWCERIELRPAAGSQELELGASRSPRHTKSWFVALIGSAFFITTWRPEKPRYFFMATNRYNHAVVSIDLTIKLFLWRQDRVALIDGDTATMRRQQLGLSGRNFDECRRCQPLSGLRLQKRTLEPVRVCALSFCLCPGVCSVWAEAMINRGGPAPCGRRPRAAPRTAGNVHGCTHTAGG